MKHLRHFPFEAAIWLSGLIALAFLEIGSSHLSLCPFYNLGFDFCMGCGLGRSISQIFHGNFIESVKIHPLGVFAVIILSYRIIELSKQYLKTIWQE